MLWYRVFPLLVDIRLKCRHGRVSEVTVAGPEEGSTHCLCSRCTAEGDTISRLLCGSRGDRQWEDNANTTSTRTNNTHTRTHTHFYVHVCVLFSLSLSSGKLEYEFLSPPQYILESGLGRKGCVGVTQPRRVAAVSIAIRVALERCCPLGQEVL